MRVMLALILLVVLALPGAALAEVRLDETKRQHLGGLVHLRGAPYEDGAQASATLVTFFASWCPPCHAEFKALNDIHGRYKSAGLKIVAINIFEDWGGLGGGEKLDAFLDRYDPAYAIVRSDQETATLFGDVTRIPTLFVFGPDGRPTLHFIHARGAEKTHVTAEEIEAAVKAALARAE